MSYHFSSLKLQYLPPELIKISFELELHHSVPRPEETPGRQPKPLWAYRVRFFPQDESPVLPVRCLKQQEFNILYEFQYPSYIQMLWIFGFIIFFFLSRKQVYFHYFVTTRSRSRLWLLKYQEVFSFTFWAFPKEAKLSADTFTLRMCLPLPSLISSVLHIPMLSFLGLHKWTFGGHSFNSTI